MKITLPKFLEKTKTTKQNDDLSFVASHHWKILLFTQFIFLVAIALFSSYLFSDVKKNININPQDTSISTTEKNLNKETLENIVQTFEMKEENTVKILETKPTIEDPALGPLTREEEREAKEKQNELLEAQRSPVSS